MRIFLVKYVRILVKKCPVRLVPGEFVTSVQNISNGKRNIGGNEEITNARTPRTDPIGIWLKSIMNCLHFSHLRETGATDKLHLTLTRPIGK